MKLTRRRLLAMSGAGVAGAVLAEGLAAELGSRALAQVAIVGEDAVTHIPGVSKLDVLDVALAPGTGTTAPSAQTLFCWVTAGEVTLTLAGRTSRYGVGDSFIVPKGAARREWNEGRVENRQIVFRVWH
jgi:quercetin dioxygenase-like cupin family protein